MLCKTGSDKYPSPRFCQKSYSPTSLGLLAPDVTSLFRSHGLLWSASRTSHPNSFTQKYIIPGQPSPIHAQETLIWFGHHFNRASPFYGREMKCHCSVIDCWLFLDTIIPTCSQASLVIRCFPLLHPKVLRYKNGKLPAHLHNQHWNKDWPEHACLILLWEGDCEPASSAPEASDILGDYAKMLVVKNNRDPSCMWIITKLRLAMVSLVVKAFL